METLALHNRVFEEIAPIVQEMMRIAQPLSIKNYPDHYISEEDVDPKLRVVEKRLVRYVFDRYLTSFNPVNWIDNVFNKNILKKDSGAIIALEIMFSNEYFVGTLTDKENMFFVRNYELFDCYFAQLHKIAKYIEYTHSKYKEVVKKSGWSE